MREYLDQTYSELYSEQRRMDIFLPFDGKGNRVGLLFIHGGGWCKGSRSQWHSVARYFCEQGYSCASISYRLTPEWKYPAQIEDARLAMSFFLQNAERFQFDPARTAIIGSSAGGHLAAMLATISADDSLGATQEMKIAETRPKAAVLYCTAFNLNPDVNNDRLNPYILQFLGRQEHEDPHVYSESSPFDRISGQEPPVLVIHGDQDEIIPIELAEQFVSRMVENGVSAELLELPNVPHGFGYDVTTEAQMKSLQAIGRFFRKVL